MKIDYISSAKILYFAEQLFKNGHSQVPGNLTQLMDMTAKEINFLVDQFEHEGLIYLNEFSVESEDKYGSFNSEFTYESNVVDRKKMEKFIEEIKKSYPLKKSPFLPRKIIILILNEIEQIFDKKQLIRILNSFPDSSYVVSQFNDGIYTLADILFRYAYTDNFSTIISEFINPIYYGIKNSDTPTALFNYIDNILLVNTSENNYNQWHKAASCHLLKNGKGLLDKISEREQPITKIEIVKMPEVEIKGWEQSVVLKKAKDKKILLHRFSENLKWEQIKITFLNEQEVIIKAKDETLQSTYELMGFEDEKRKLPNKQWMLLRLFSVQDGSITWDNNNKLTLKQINAVKKQKQLLSEGLRTYFQISSDPFCDYKQENAYKIKIGLVPEKGTVAPSEKDIYEDDDSDNLDTQIKKSFSSQTPEKYKDEKYNEDMQ